MIKKTYKNEIIQVIDKQSKTCDKCECEIKNSAYDRTDYKIESREGSVYPEGGTLECETADLCYDCFLKVKEILINHGVKFYTHDEDY